MYERGEKWYEGCNKWHERVQQVVREGTTSGTRGCKKWYEGRGSHGEQKLHERAHEGGGVVGKLNRGRRV